MTRRAVRLAVLLLLAAWVGSARAAGPVFVLRTADGHDLSGPLGQLTASGAVRLGGAAGGEAADWLELRQSGRPLPDWPQENLLLFLNGDCVSAKQSRLVGERLTFLPNLGGEGSAQVTVTALAAVWDGAPEGTIRPDAHLRALADGPRPRDRVLLRNGDLVEGLLSALDGDRVEVQRDGKPVAVKRNRIAAVSLSTEFTTPLRPKGRAYRLVLLNGDRVTLEGAACDGTTLTGRTLFGASVRQPLAQVVALYTVSGKAVFLSELKPTKYEATSYLDVAWPYRFDRSLSGRGQWLGGSLYDRGIALHSGGRLTFELGGAYGRFETQVGLDDHAGRRGRATVRVLVDAKPVFEKVVVGGAAPAAVRVDVAGTKTLTLVVDHGDQGDVGNHVHWVDARLVKR